MHQEMFEISISTDGQGCYEISDAIANWISNQQLIDGLLTVFIRHTSASLTIQENADHDVQLDLTAALDNLAPRDGNYHHVCEGPDDMPAHIKSALTSVSLTIPVMGAQMVLGTWQGVYLLEHRDAPHTRNLVLHFIGTATGS